MPQQPPADIPDEHSRLLQGGAEADAGHGTFHGEDIPEPADSSPPNNNPNSQVEWTGSLVLLLSVFLVNTDSSIVLALFRNIASDFNSLGSASWVINSYVIGMIIAQPLYGKLSDIYGQKPLLLLAYSCCILGGLLAGTGFSFYGILAGRVLAGVGGAGIAVLISTLIVDLAPKKDIAVWRSFVYAVNHTGRALGPSLGGIISDNTNWRWALLYSAPLNLLSLIYISRKMSFPLPQQHPHTRAKPETPPHSKLRRIDFSGAITLGLANCSLLLFLDQAQRGLDILNNQRALIFAGIWIVSIISFIVIEAAWAREPILPLQLLSRRDVLSSYAIQFLQTAAQMAFYTSVPLYFRVTRRDSDTSISMRLLIITLGTVIGGLASGFVIRTTGLYRLPIWISLSVSNASLLAIFIRWHGHTGWLESLYGFPVGLGFGVSLSAAFIGLTARLKSSEVAVSTGGFYLSLNLGSLFGVSISSMLIVVFVERNLLDSLKDFPDRQDILRDVLSNLGNIDRLSGRVKDLVIQAYTDSLIHVWVYALICGCMALIASLVMHQEKVEDTRTSELSNKLERLRQRIAASWKL